MKIKPGIEEQPLGEGLLIYDKAKDKVLMLNRTAAFIYRRIKSGQDVEHIERALKKSFEMGAGDDLKADIKEALAQLAGAGILPDAEQVEA